MPKEFAIGDRTYTVISNHGEPQITWDGHEVLMFRVIPASATTDSPYPVRSYALKLVIRDNSRQDRDAFILRCRHEAETAIRARSQPDPTGASYRRDIVEVVSHGVVPDPEGGRRTAYAIIMEWLEETLQSFRKRCGGSLRPLEAAMLVAKVAQAVSACHTHSEGPITHGDLTSVNVMFRETNGVSVPVLTDFELARLTAPSVTPGLLTIARVGNDPYMAPEQFDQSHGGPYWPIDVYALGVILYELITGQSPIAADHDHNYAVITPTVLPSRIKSSDRISLSESDDLELVDWLDRVCYQCMRKLAVRRPTAQQVAADLQEIVNGQEPSAPVITSVMEKEDEDAFNPRLRERLRETHEQAFRQRRRLWLGIRILGGVSLVALVTLLFVNAGIRNSQHSVEKSLDEVKEERHSYWVGQRQELLKKLEILDDSETTRELAKNVSREFPEEIPIQLTTVTLDLIKARTPGQHKDLPVQVDRILRNKGIEDTKCYQNLFVNLASQHALLIELIELGFNKNPKPRSDLVRLERENNKMLSSRPELKSLVDTLPTLKRLMETVQVFNQTSGRDNPQEGVSGYGPGLWWMYWQEENLGEHLKQNPDASAELHCHYALCVFTHIASMEKSVDSEKILDLLHLALRSSEQARRAKSVAPTPILNAKTRLLEARASLMVLRCIPQLTKEQISTNFKTLRNALEGVDGSPLDAQLFVRYFTVAGICDLPLPAQWKDGRTVHQDRIDRLNAFGSNLLHEWNEREASPWSVLPKTWSSSIIQDIISEELLKKINYDLKTKPGKLFDNLIPIDLTSFQIPPLSASVSLREFAAERLRHWYDVENKRFSKQDKK
jgi:serine/threonine protein kinase